MNTQFKLGRIKEHDSRSLAFGFDTTGIIIKDVTHARYIPILNQGQLSSCTGNAGIGAISSAPFDNIDNKVYSRDENGALKLYGDAEKIDGGAGYPPEDVGSSGLSIAKALSNAGLISGYQHTFTLFDALKALTVYPIIVGVSWYSDMFNPDADGRVHPTGTVEGGHEIQAYRIDCENGRVWFHNSWGNSWGVNGDFYITWADFAILLNQGGDVMVLLPVTHTPPPINKMNTVTITRQPSDAKETLGTLTTTVNGTTFTYNTQERPWLNNQHNISDIPTGTYICNWTFWASRLSSHYLLQNVLNRSGIFIHAGNYFTNSAGCILLGVTGGDINGDGEKDVINSRVTLSAFEALMGKKPFTLIIQ